jgi:hypothetical protein
LVALALAIALALSVLVGHWGADALREQAVRGLRAQIRTAARDLALRLDDRMSDLRQMSSDATVLGLIADTPRLQSWLDSRLETTPGAVWVGMADTSGKVVAASKGILTGESVAERNWLAIGRSCAVLIDRHVGILLAKLLAPRNEPLRLVDVAASLTDRDGRTVGVLAIHFRWEQLRGGLDRIAASLRSEAAM